MKYQDKIRASWETTESGRLALGIHDIENADFRKKNEWLRDGPDLLQFCGGVI